MRIFPRTLWRALSLNRERTSRSAAVAALLVLVGFGTNLPVPLVLLYQTRFDLSGAAAAGLFGVYAAGLIPSMLVAGPLSDRIGPKLVLFAGGLISVLVSVGFALGSRSILALLIVRAMQGVAAGAVFTVGSSWLQRLWADMPGRGARRAAVSMTGGFAAGSLAGGIWGEWLSAPLIAPFVLHAIGCLAVVLMIVGVVDIQVATSRSGGAYLREGMRCRALFVVAPPALFVFGFPATAINAVPLLVDIPGAPVAVTGILGAITLGTGAVAAPWQARLGERTVPLAGFMGAIGMLAVALVLKEPATFAVLIPGCMALGAGGGLALSGGLARIPVIAKVSRQGAVTAGFYSIAYAGFGIPLILTKVSLHPEWSLLVMAGLCSTVWLLQWPRWSFSGDWSGHGVRGRTGHGGH